MQGYGDNQYLLVTGLEVAHQPFIYEKHRCVGLKRCVLILSDRKCDVLPPVPKFVVT